MKFTTTFFCLLLSYFSFGQDYYLIHFKSKTNTATYFSNPLQMLSQRALDRREVKNVALDDKDVPINNEYIQQLKNLNLEYIGKSKWLNAAMVEIADPAVIPQIENLSFVQTVESLVRNNPRNAQSRQLYEKFSTTDFNYGYSNVFIEQMNLAPLHQAGYSGQNVLVGVIDSGFPGVNTINAFAALRNENRIVDSKNFVNQNSIYQMHSHGTIVLATMAAKVDNVYVGSAPDAHYALYVSEDAAVETPKELLYWVQAAERADSVGVDLINTSLGYTTFDDARYDFTYDDMDGNTAIISKGAKIAASRGIFLVNAMGNDGNNSWHYVSAPADTPEVFSIGALDENLYPAGFTSYGPNALGIRKPNVSALGVYTPTYSPSGDVVASSGTSLSSPVMAGAIASLMSAFRTTSLDVLKNSIENSAHLYPTYSAQLGYGVPNFGEILETLQTKDFVPLDVKIYPNPATQFFKVNSTQEIKKIELLDWSGKVIKTNYLQKEMNVEHISKGVYFVRISFASQTFHYKLIIQ